MNRLRVVTLTACVVALSVSAAALARSHHHHETVVIRQVLLLTPGTAFDFGQGYQGQVGRAHVEYWQKLRDEGKIEMAGHFSGNKGGMIIAADGVSGSELQRLANGDPSVKSMVLQSEVRSWQLTVPPKKVKKPEDDGD